MKNLFFVSMVTIVLLLSACRGDSGRKDTKRNSNKTDIVVIEDTAEKPVVNVYIENSASMDGYVHGVTEFEQTVYNYLSDIKISDFTDSLNLFYINSQIIQYGSDIADFIEKLEPVTFRQRGGNRSTTDIANVFKIMLGETKKNDVAILVTDGIFSPGKGKDAQQYLVNQQIGIKNSMADYLRVFPNTAVVVNQLTSNFNGRYFNREDSPTNINTQRPYYIWIIGDIRNIVRLKSLFPDTNFKGNGIQNTFTLLPASENNVDYAILNVPKSGSFERDKKSPKTSIYNIKKADKGNFMFTVGMDLSVFSILLGDEYLMSTDSYVRLINKQPNNDYFIEVEYNTNPNTNYTHNMKLTTDIVATGELEIALRNNPPAWIYEMNDDDGYDIRTEGAINKTFGIKYHVEGVCQAYQMRGNEIYTTLKFNLKK